MASNKTDFTSGKIYMPLIKFMIPVFCASLLQVMYGAVDLIVVGRFAETADVSAVSTGSQVTSTITSVIMGLTMGVTVLLGHSIGMKKLDEAGSVIGGGIVFFVIVAAVVTAVIPANAGAIATILKAPAEAFEQSVAYIRICMLGAIFIVAYNVLCSIFRGIGDSKTPLMAVMIACVVNIFGDMFLVAKCHMGSAGVAIATVAAQAVSVVVCLVVLSKRALPFNFNRSMVRFDKKIIGKIVQIGAPLAFQDFLVSVSFLVVIAIVNNLGVVISAGVGVASKVNGFVMLFPSAMSQAVSVFSAQNYGAAQYERAAKGLKYGVITALCVSSVVFCVAFFRGDILASFFSNDPEVIAAAAQYLKGFSPDTILTSVMFCFTGFFTGFQRTGFVMCQGIASAFGIRIPIAYFMSKQVPASVSRIAMATPSSTFVQCILCFVYFRHVKKQIMNRKNGKDAQVEID